MELYENYILCKHSHTLKTAAALGFPRPSNEVRSSFEKYIQNGLNITEAMEFHEDTLEANGNSEETLANAYQNPKARTVQYWHDEWRKLNFGTRTGQDVYEERILILLF